MPEWVRGISASVRTALAAAGETVRAAAVIVPVDTPDLPAAVVARMAEGADVSTMAVETQKDLAVYVNKAAAERMGVTIPEDVLAGAEVVG